MELKRILGLFLAFSILSLTTKTNAQKKEADKKNVCQAQEQKISLLKQELDSIKKQIANLERRAFFKDTIDLKKNEQKNFGTPNRPVEGMIFIVAHGNPSLSAIALSTANGKVSLLYGGKTENKTPMWSDSYSTDDKSCKFFIISHRGGFSLRSGVGKDQDCQYVQNANDKYRFDVYILSPHNK